MRIGPKMPEQPVYRLQQVKKRALLPKIFSLLILGSLFYLGVLLNLSLVNVEAQQETAVKTVSLIIVLLLVGVGIVFSIRAAARPYLFYRNRIQFGKKEILYVNITNTAPGRNITDKVFKTYSINLGSRFLLRHIPAGIELQSYLQQLVEYAKRTQQ